MKVLKQIPYLLIISGLVFGCASPKHLSPDYGKACKAAFAAQVINPDAPEDPSPADTLPGDIAQKIYKERYIKGLTEEKKTEETASQQLQDMED